MNESAHIDFSVVGNDSVDVQSGRRLARRLPVDLRCALPSTPALRDRLPQASSMGERINATTRWPRSRSSGS